MSGTRPRADAAATRDAAHSHADHLRRRVRVLDVELAHTEESLARVYEWSASLRPHASDRLRDEARRVRDRAGLRRERARRAALRTGQVGGGASSDHPGGSPDGRHTTAS